MASKKEVLNVFHRNNTDMMEHFINYIIDRADGYESFKDRMEMREFANSRANTEPDTYACDCVFIRLFPSDEMLEDFPEIARDFLFHEYQNIQKYDQVQYISDYKFFGNTAEGYITWILNLMMNAIKQGNPYTIGLFQYLFQTYYKRDYKFLKRFRRINRYEIYDIAEDNGQSAVLRMPIIITMCRLYGIELDQNCSSIYFMYEDFPDHYINEDEPEEFTGFSKEVVDYSIERITEEMKNTGSEYVNLRNKHFKMLRDGERFIHEAEKWLGLKKGFVADSDEELWDYNSAMIRALEILRSMEPDREYSFDEIQSYALLLKSISALGCYHDYSQECQKRYLGLSEDMFEYEREKSWFKPEKVKIPSSPSTQVKGSGIKKSADESKRKNETSPVSATDKKDELQALLEEMDNLRAKIRKKEQENSSLREKNKELDLNLKEAEAFKETYSSEHEELVHLRNYVYQLTEEEEKVPETDVRAMEMALKEKKIVIIGGHSNWIYKLRNKFSKWVFLKPEINNTFDGSVLADADHIYFFTDILSHGTYGKYMKIIRSQGMTNYGYIHSINISGNIKQIYEDVCGE